MEMAKDPTEMTEEEFFAKIERAEQQIANGEGMEMLPGEDLTAFLKETDTMYKVIITPEAAKDMVRLAHSEPNAFAKVNRFIEELRQHPKTGTGHPEPLRGKPEGRWSRQITKKHRLVYRIFETEVYVDVLSAYGHYNDK